MSKNKPSRALKMEERLALMGLEEEAKAICGQYGVTLEEARGRDRHTHIAAARHHLWAFLSGKGFSANAIGIDWGVHHTTVAAAIRKVKKQGAEDGGK